MTQDNKIRFEHIIDHFQAIAAMEMVDKAAFRKKMMGKMEIKRTNGLQRNLAETKQPFPNGELTLVNLL